MTRHLFRHLRHCRALFALALCAWLALASVAWAQESCCASMSAATDMVMHHATNTHDHAPGHPETVMPDCGLCAHVATSVSPSLTQGMPQALPAAQGWQANHEAAPQPLYEPPLRPPAA